MSIERIRQTAWEEVFANWRGREETSERWQHYWKAKGYPSWEAWRTDTYRNLRGPELDWALFRVADPLEEVPQWRGGMFHTWATWFYPVLEEQPPRLRDLLAHPGVHNHWLIRQLARDFPKATEVMGIRMPNGDIVVTEGMHRCCALALAARDRLPVAIELTVALADWPFGGVPRLGSWEEK